MVILPRIQAGTRVERMNSNLPHSFALLMKSLILPGMWPGFKKEEYRCDAAVSAALRVEPTALRLYRSRFLSPGFISDADFGH